MPGSVLVVDDEKMIRWSLKKRLELEGYSVVEADSGDALFSAPFNDRSHDRAGDTAPSMLRLGVNIEDIGFHRPLRPARAGQQGSQPDAAAAHHGSLKLREESEVLAGFNQRRSHI